MTTADSDIDKLLRSLDTKLQKFGADHSSLQLRGKVLRLVDIYKSVRSLNKKVVMLGGCDAGSARERLRLYLIHNVGVVIDALELEV